VDALCGEYLHGDVRGAGDESVVLKLDHHHLRLVRVDILEESSRFQIPHCWKSGAEPRLGRWGNGDRDGDACRGTFDRFIPGAGALEKRRKTEMSETTTTATAHRPM
jgi:hypothetical protein